MDKTLLRYPVPPSLPFVRSSNNTRLHLAVPLHFRPGAQGLPPCTATVRSLKLLPWAKHAYPGWSKCAHRRASAVAAAEPSMVVLPPRKCTAACASFTTLPGKRHEFSLPSGGSVLKLLRQRNDVYPGILVRFDRCAVLHRAIDRKALAKFFRLNIRRRRAVPEGWSRMCYQPRSR